MEAERIAALEAEEARRQAEASAVRVPLTLPHTCTPSTVTFVFSASPLHWDQCEFNIVTQQSHVIVHSTLCYLTRCVHLGGFFWDEYPKLKPEYSVFFSVCRYLAVEHCT